MPLLLKLPRSLPRLNVAWGRVVLFSSRTLPFILAGLDDVCWLKLENSFPKSTKSRPHPGGTPPRCLSWDSPYLLIILIQTLLIILIQTEKSRFGEFQLTELVSGQPN